MTRVEQVEGKGEFAHKILRDWPAVRTTGRMRAIIPGKCRCHSHNIHTSNISRKLIYGLFWCLHYDKVPQAT